MLLGINKNRGDVLAPIGGALEFHEESRPFLAGLGALFQQGCDLRLLLPRERLASFEEWFGRREGRETDPLRELREELAVIPASGPAAVVQQKTLGRLMVHVISGSYSRFKVY